MMKRVLTTGRRITEERRLVKHKLNKHTDQKTEEKLAASIFGLAVVGGLAIVKLRFKEDYDYDDEDE